MTSATPRMTRAARIGLIVLLAGYGLSRDGLAFWESVHLYRTLLRTPWWHFILILFGSFIGANVLFRFLYTLSGQGALTGQGQGHRPLGWPSDFSPHFFQRAPRVSPHRRMCGNRRACLQRNGGSGSDRSLCVRRFLCSMVSELPIRKRTRGGSW